MILLGYFVLSIEYFFKGSTLFSQFRDFLGTGVFNSDGGFPLSKLEAISD